MQKFLMALTCVTLTACGGEVFMPAQPAASHPLANNPNTQVANPNVHAPADPNSLAAGAAVLAGLGGDANVAANAFFAVASNEAGDGVSIVLTAPTVDCNALTPALSPNQFVVLVDATADSAHPVAAGFVASVGGDNSVGMQVVNTDAQCQISDTTANAGTLQVTGYTPQQSLVGAFSLQAGSVNNGSGAFNAAYCAQALTLGAANPNMTCKP